MRAAVFHGDGVLRLEARPEPRIEAPDDVIIEVEACGICGTDLKILAVPPGHPAAPPVVMGHEFVGRVVAAGPAAVDVRVGQRVVVDPAPKCGNCVNCRAGRPASCENVVALGIFRDGALARFTRAPASAVYPISDSVPGAIAALTEPLACVVNGAGKAQVRPGESVVILGAGAIGCLFVALFKAAGANPILVVEPSARRAEVAATVGADHVVTPEGFAAVRIELLPRGADILVDAVGTQLATAVEHAALGGRIVLFGQDSNARPPIHQYEITQRSLTIMGAYITAFTFPPAIRLIEQGSLVLAPIVSSVVPLEDLERGLALLRAGEATKVIVTP